VPTKIKPAETRKKAETALEIRPDTLGCLSAQAQNEVTTGEPDQSIVTMVCVFCPGLSRDEAKLRVAQILQSNSPDAALIRLLPGFFRKTFHGSAR
jgi:hypothetical protein